jgi:hypothetical protein
VNAPNAPALITPPDATAGCAWHKAGANIVMAAKAPVHESAFHPRRRFIGNSLEFSTECFWSSIGKMPP